MCIFAVGIIGERCIYPSLFIHFGSNSCIGSDDHIFQRFTVHECTRLQFTQSVRQVYMFQLSAFRKGPMIDGFYCIRQNDTFQTCTMESIPADAMQCRAPFYFLQIFRTNKSVIPNAGDALTQYYIFNLTHLICPRGILSAFTVFFRILFHPKAVVIRHITFPCNGQHTIFQCPVYMVCSSLRCVCSAAFSKCPHSQQHRQNHCTRNGDPFEITAFFIGNRFLFCFLL